MTETELIRIKKDLSIKLRQAVNDYDFTVRDLVQWILSTVDLNEYAKKLSHEVKSEEEISKEAEETDEQEADEEETNTDEERDESADDEAEDFGKY